MKYTIFHFYSFVISLFRSRGRDMGSHSRKLRYMSIRKISLRRMSLDIHFTRTEHTLVNISFF